LSIFAIDPSFGSLVKKISFVLPIISMIHLEDKIKYEMYLDQFAQILSGISTYHSFYDLEEIRNHFQKALKKNIGVNASVKLGCFMASNFGLKRIWRVHSIKDYKYK